MIYLCTKNSSFRSVVSKQTKSNRIFTNNEDVNNVEMCITPEDITPNAHDVVLTITAYLIIEG